MHRAGERRRPLHRPERHRGWLSRLGCGRLDALCEFSRPTEEVTSEVTYTANSAEKTFATVAVNNPGVPCGPDPEADNGHTIVEPAIYISPKIGEFSGAGSYEFPSTGCVHRLWLAVEPQRNRGPRRSRRGSGIPPA